MFIASAAISTQSDATSYYVYDSNIPLHHALGLIHYGRQQISAGITADGD